MSDKGRTLIGMPDTVPIPAIGKPQPVRTPKRPKRPRRPV